MKLNSLRAVFGAALVGAMFSAQAVTLNLTGWANGYEVQTLATNSAPSNAVTKSPAAGALVIAERLRRAIEEHPFLEPQGIAARISASFGISTYPDHALSPEGLIQKADQAMYRVKEREKNGIEVAV